MSKSQKDLFGNTVESDPLLRHIFIEPPFSVLDTKSGNWQNRKRLWKKIGIKSEVGRKKNMTFAMSVDQYRDKSDDVKQKQKDDLNTSVFDPALCEVLYHWFVPKGGRILDPFAGGSVRGVVANYLGYRYTGIDIRPEQVKSNREQAKTILKPDNQPTWIAEDSDDFLTDVISSEGFDFVFSCPPYADLEVYSDMEKDVSNMPYDKFIVAYRSIINKACKLLKSGGYACFVVGEVRNKDGNFYGFVPDTIKAFEDAGVRYYNEAILLNPVASGSMRAKGNMKSQKLVKIHQNILVFKKP